MFFGERSYSEEIIRVKRSFAMAKGENEFLKNCFFCKESATRFSFIKHFNFDRLIGRGTNIP